MPSPSSGPLRRAASRLSSRAAAAAAPRIEVRQLPGRGRGLLAADSLAAGAEILRCVPMAQVLKEPAAAACCAQCCGALPAAVPAGAAKPALCSAACSAAFAARGGDMLHRCDLRELDAIHEEQGRKFPLLVAHLLAHLLADLKNGTLPSAWPPLELCHAVLEPAAMPQVEREHAALHTAFAAAGLADAPTLELLLPLQRYAQLLGAAQLNAFELCTSRGLRISCLLPAPASLFNHSCEPNVLISCADDHEVGFVMEREAAPEEELCISYVDLERPGSERRHLLLHKYGFECGCPRCARGD